MGTSTLTDRALSMLRHHDKDVRTQGLELYRAISYPRLPPPENRYAVLVIHGSFIVDPSTAGDIDYLYHNLSRAEAEARVLEHVATTHGADSPLLHLRLDGHNGYTVPTWRVINEFIPGMYRLPHPERPLGSYWPPPLYRCLYDLADRVRVKQYRSLSSKIRRAAATRSGSIDVELRVALADLEELYLAVDCAVSFGGYTNDHPAALRLAWRKLDGAQQWAALDALPDHWRPIWRWLIEAERDPPEWLLDALRLASGSGGLLLHWSRHLEAFTGQHSGRFSRESVLGAFNG